MNKLLSLLFLAVTVSSFSIVPSSRANALIRPTSARSLIDKRPQGLETVESSADADALSSLSTTQTPKNIVKDMNTGEIKEVKWVDPAMQANTSPWVMDWWAYPLTLFPIVLLLDDVFHFLPKK